MAQIAIVEDQSLLLNLLQDLCERDFGHEVVLTAQSQAELFDKLPAPTPRVILLDLNLPDCSGIDLAKKLQECLPGCGIIAVSGETTPYILHQVLEARFQGFVDKNADPRKIGEAIDAVLSGRPYYTDFITQARRDLFRATDSFTKVLSNTEMALLPFFGQGLHNEDIARERGLSAATVQTHRRNIMAKLGLHSSLDLMNYAIKSGFVMVRVG
ncbi:response regulator transcription factor [Actomonas aquatica]|uniref:Response regulator transcription factor n=1 Tax=Actomonas aquatica TaxID=2866162 RepID=A0ABZ1CHH9_9BACT|nr:response regulator transcription factor [Opitutus sp. WL0086]WRQ90039.1 response regulator transcription factor [Opitutus sp. WL0086]